MSEKVKVSKEVAEAIEDRKRTVRYSYDDFMKTKYGKGFSHSADALNHISGELLSRILLNDYEMETPEERTLKEFKAINGACTPNTAFGQSAIEQRKGFLRALDAMEIKIKGVNLK